MKTQTKDRIIEFISTQQQVSPKDIIAHIGLTPPAVFRHLSKLVENGILKKQGTPPKVFYSVVRTSEIQKHYSFDPQIERFINENFLKITPSGELQTGIKAFIRWCDVRKIDPVKTSTEYVTSVKKFDTYKENGLINGLRKIKQTFPIVYLDELYYLEFYTIERFGKTKLGELILYAKQSQSHTLMNIIAKEVHDRILDTIKRHKIDAIGFIPHTVQRKVQFLKELENQLRLSVPSMKITKIRTPIIVPQKTLSKLDERIENAQQSMVVEETKTFKNILLIDDVVGSGATINEIASQIRSKKICSGKIIGLALAGSFNGFEIIREA
ncbi:MAG: ArsR family transcriptional regulator [bacterium]|nr:ArsR family transcriptional regulator [bacterium]